MSEYKLLIKTGQVKGTRSLFRFDGIKAPGVEGHPSVPGLYRCINQVGYVSESIWDGMRYLFTREGAVVSPGQSLYVKGFTQIFQYDTGAGLQSFDEDDWSTHFVSETTPVSNVYTVPVGVRSIRVQATLAEEEVFNEELFYVAATGGTRPPFIGVKDKWERLDMGSEKPALTIQSNDLAELKDRQAEYTQELILPLTGRNLRILGHPHLSDSDTDSPYKFWECRLFAGENQLVRKGAVLSVEGVTEEGIEAQILGASIGLFAELSDTPMSDITEPSFVRSGVGMFHPSEDPGVVQPNAITGSIIAHASFFRGKEYPVLGMSPAYTLPFVYARWMFETIIAAKGFSWEHNLGEYEGEDRLALPVVDLQPDEDSFDAFKTGGGEFYGEVNPGAVRYLIPTITDDACGLLTTTGLNGSGNEAYTTLLSPVSCHVGLTIWLNFPYATGSYPIKIELSVVAGGEDVLSYSYQGEGLVSPDDEHTLSVDLSAGVPLVIVASYTSNVGTPPSQMLAFHRIAINDFKAEKVLFGGKVHIPRNLGFETQGDFVKAFIQAHGLTVKVDRGNMTLYTYTMKRLYDRKEYAVDWTNKITRGQSQSRFEAGEYAQSNDITMKDNDEDEYNDKATFTIDDETLPLKKSLFELGFEAGYDWTFTDGTPVANIPVFAKGDDPDASEQENLDAANLSPGQPHLVRIGTSSRLVKSGMYPYDFKVRCKVASHVSAQELLDTFYPEIVGGMLNRAKVLTAKFNLSALDIERFDPFTPVYLKQHGAFFYVNKISNFVSGQLTTVELIKL